MISADQATLVLIGTVETLGCLPPHSNEKAWPPLVSKVTKAYCNCTFSNGVSHARTPTPVMTITIMSLGSTGAFQSSVILGKGLLVNCGYGFRGCNTAFDYDTSSHWNLFLYHHAPTDFITATQTRTWLLHKTDFFMEYSQILTLLKDILSALLVRTNYFLSPFFFSFASLWVFLSFRYLTYHNVKDSNQQRVYKVIFILFVFWVKAWN